MGQRCWRKKWRRIASLPMIEGGRKIESFPMIEGGRKIANLLMIEKMQ